MYAIQNLLAKVKKGAEKMHVYLKEPILEHLLRNEECKSENLRSGINRVD